MADRTYDPHRSVSVALTAVRTVLSRAHTAKHEITEAETGRYAPNAAHPGGDVTDMQAALDEVITRLQRWERLPARHRGGRYA